MHPGEQSRTTSGEKLRLCAVLFSDIVGYSSLVKRDELLARELLDSHVALMRQYLAMFEGREVEIIGDAFLIEFPSAVLATQCALAYQRAQYDQNESRGEELRFRIRIGIHICDVAERDGRLFGHGINYAARIEPLSPAGGIALSKPAFEAVNSRLNLPLVSLGLQNLKNVDPRAEVFAMDESGILTGKNLLKLPKSDCRKLGEKNESHRVLCVLPFMNQSEDPSHEYLCVGISEDIATDLTKVASLTIVPRNKAIEYKNDVSDPESVAEKLNATHILTGRLRASGNRIRLSVELLGVEDNGIIWAERFDRELKDVFDLQDDLSKAIVEQIASKVGSPNLESRKSRGTSNPDAYRAYLRARHLYFTRTHEGLPQVMALVHHALMLDPTYAQAWALKATVLISRYTDNGEPLAGEEEIQTALQLNARSAEVKIAESRLLQAKGLINESQIAALEAVELAPYSFDANDRLAHSAFTRKDFVLANERFLRAASFGSEEEAYGCKVRSAVCLFHLGFVEEARATALEMLPVGKVLLLNDSKNHTASQGQITLLAIAGERGQCLDLLNSLRRTAPDNLAARYNNVCVLCLLGETVSALDDWEHVTSLLTIPILRFCKTDPGLDAIRSQPRFVASLEKAEARLLTH